MKSSPFPCGSAVTCAIETTTSAFGPELGGGVRLVPQEVRTSKTQIRKAVCIVRETIVTSDVDAALQPRPSINWAVLQPTSPQKPRVRATPVLSAKPRVSSCGHAGAMQRGRAKD